MATSRLDCCNSLYVGLSFNYVQKSQVVQNEAACMLMELSLEDAHSVSAVSSVLATYTVLNPLVRCQSVCLHRGLPC